MSDNIVGTKKAAEILGVSISTVYRMIEQGILDPSKTPGGQRRFDVAQLEAFKANSRNIAAPQNPYMQKKAVEADGEITSADEAHDSVDVVPDNKPVDPRNTLNDLNGSQWLPETKSFFYQKGLGAKHPHAQIERQHPAPYSFQDVAHLITFFTKKGMRVLDPFGGVGSTAKACELEGRLCTSIELQPRWRDLAVQRLEVEVGEGTSRKHEFILGDSRVELQRFGDRTFDFMVTNEAVICGLTPEKARNFKEFAA